MSDNTVEIKFTNDLLTDATGNPGITSGTIDVDYTSGTYTIFYTFRGGGNTVANSSGGSLPLMNSNGVYTVGFAGFTASYTGQQPAMIDHLQFITTQGDNYGANNAVAMSSVTCFCTGTRISTVRGQIPVEQLSVGDIVLNSSGEPRPIRWLGHRTIDCRSLSEPLAVLPICVSAHAFSFGQPARDLLVSPGHSICIDFCGELLIPAGMLVNGTTIKQVDVDSVTYWHIEHDSHEVILAENLRTESYLEMGNRSFFLESPVVAVAVAPDPRVNTHANFCRPFINDGPILHGVRARLEKRSAQLAGRLAKISPATADRAA